MPYGTIEDDFKIGYHGDNAASYLYNLWGEPQCCCIAAKCDMPESITVTLKGFWGEWALRRGGVYHSTHTGLPGVNCRGADDGDCLTTLRSAWYNGTADGLLDLTWYPARETTYTADAGPAQLCIQNPEMLEFFPGMQGDPPTPISVDAIYFNNSAWDCAYSWGGEFCGGNISFVHGRDVYWRARMIDYLQPLTDEGFEQALKGWTVKLPSCVYTFEYYVPTCHILGAHAGDLEGQTAVLRRRDAVMPPTLRPNITRSRTPQAGEVFTDAHLLFDVYLRPFQTQWADRDGDELVDANFDGRTMRFSVDYVCNPREYIPDAQGYYNNWLYKCKSPGGIVPPKLRASQGSGGAEIDFVIEPVPGTGSTPNDTLWQVASVSVKTAGSGASLGDVFSIDFYESPARGGEYKDSTEPQTAVVAEVGTNGEVRRVILENGPEGKRVFFGRFLCHPNGVALRGSGYSEGDQIEWRIVEQPPELGGGRATEYARARAIVTEVDEKGGILDWHLRGARHGDGDDQHTGNYLWCEEEHPNAPTCTSSTLAAIDCRGLYSDVMNIERCKIIYQGHVGFRASAHREAWAANICDSYFCFYQDCSCGGDSACFSNYCGINTIPITFEIYDVETRLRVDITQPQDVKPLDSCDVVTIGIISADEVEPATPLEIPSVPSATYGNDFVEVPGPQEDVVSGDADGLNISGVSTNPDRVGREWKVSVVASVTHGEVAIGESGARRKAIPLTGTAEQVDAALADLMYWAPAGDPAGSANGPDLLAVTMTITPPGYEAPLLAVAKASELEDRCEAIPSGSIAGGIVTCGDEAILDYWLGVVFLVMKGFEYPSSRPLGGIASYEVTQPGAGYAWWDASAKAWVEHPSLRVHVLSAWDGLRIGVKSGYRYDMYAHAKAEVDTDIDSSTFGQVASVEPEPGTWGDGKGWWYNLHEHDRLWLAQASWNFSYGMYRKEGGYITSAQFPNLIHRDGYTFPRTHLCDLPNLECFGDSLSSQCPDPMKACRPRPSDHLWSLNYCPHDLFKKYEMMMPAEGIQQPNTPTQITKESFDKQWAYTPLVYGDDGSVIGGGNLYPKCTNGPLHLINPAIEYTPCEDICLYDHGSWCEHPHAAVTHDSVCWVNRRPNFSEQGSWPWYGEGFIYTAFTGPSALYLDFGNGPITLEFQANDDGQARKGSIY